MRLAFNFVFSFNSFPPNCGIAHYEYALIQSLLEHSDYEIYGFGFSPMKEVFKEYKKFTFIPIDSYFEKFSFTAESFNYFLNVILPVLIKRYNITIYHGIGNYDIPMGTCSSKLVLSLHDIIPYTSPDIFSWKIKGAEARKFYYHYQMKGAYKHADVIICSSNYTKKEILRYLPKRDLKVIYIPPYLVDFEKQRKYTFPYIICTSGISSRKNIESVIDSFAQFHKRHTEYHLVITGRINEEKVYYENLTNQVRQLHLEKNIIFTGLIKRDKLLSMLAGASAMLLLSKNEGYSYPLVEAILFGIPSVIANVTSLPEIAEKAAILVDPNDTDKIAYQLHKVIFDKDVRISLKNEIKNRKHRFLDDLFIKKMKAIYENLVKK